MFRVIFFILFFSLTLYGIWWLFTPLRTIKQQDVNARYKAYLSGALARNSWDFERYNVVFYTKDFSDGEKSRPSPQWNNNWSQVERENQNLYKSSLSTSLRGNFGKPEIIAAPTVSLRDSSCAGIFYDPCITLEIPDNWKLGNMYLGTTPIYDNPNLRG
jgi:hypothetical protein